MFKVLLLLFGFGTLEAKIKYILCDTPRVEAFYEMCDDESFAPVIKVEGCELSKHTYMNISLTAIPRKNIDRLYAMVEIWKESVTVSFTRFELCTGVDDEFDFCGALKGETVTFFYDGRFFRKLQLLKGLYTVKYQLLVGEKEELLLCFLGTLKVKAALF
ncbi:lymphocyte antigen 96 [Anomaloglossus baeobatrachus]|uniref:lymphocyte antigen 96 n=1 Tax=Anomaloglossus baeobatrachus TaxID=238106 RepID=UPI003F503A53